MCVCVCVCLVATDVCVCVWAGQLLSAMAWCQVAVLCGYDRKHVSRSMHSAVQWVYGDTTYDSAMTATYVHQTVALLPLARCCHLRRVCTHIQGHVHWKGDAYSTWVIPEKASPNSITGAWCQDFNILQQGLCVCVTGRVHPGLTPSPHSSLPKLRLQYSSGGKLPKDSSPPFVQGTVSGSFVPLLPSGVDSSRWALDRPTVAASACTPSTVPPERRLASMTCNGCMYQRHAPVVYPSQTQCCPSQPLFPSLCLYVVSLSLSDTLVVYHAIRSFCSAFSFCVLQ